MNSGGQRFSQLRWQCRRGMKELDVLLEAFLAREETALRVHAWPEFEELLRLEDDLLWDAMQGRESALPDSFRALVRVIRRSF